MSEKDGGAVMEIFEQISGIFDLVVNYLILIVEFIGIVILIYAVVSAVIGLIRRQPHTRMERAFDFGCDYSSARGVDIPYSVGN